MYKIMPTQKPLYGTSEAYLFHLLMVQGHQCFLRHFSPPSHPTLLDDIFRLDIIWHFQFNIANTLAAELKVHPEEGLNSGTSAKKSCLGSFPNKYLHVNSSRGERWGSALHHHLPCHTHIWPWFPGEAPGDVLKVLWRVNSGGDSQEK